MVSDCTVSIQGGFGVLSKGGLLNTPTILSTHTHIHTYTLSLSHAHIKLSSSESSLDSGV